MTDRQWIIGTIGFGLVASIAFLAVWFLPKGEPSIAATLPVRNVSAGLVSEPRNETSAPATPEQVLKSIPAELLPLDPRSAPSEDDYSRIGRFLSERWVGKRLSFSAQPKSRNALRLDQSSTDFTLFTHFERVAVDQIEGYGLVMNVTLQGSEPSRKNAQAFVARPTDLVSLDREILRVACEGGGGWNSLVFNVSLSGEAP